MVHELTRAIDLARTIDDRVQVLKLHSPYHESDHVRAIAYNLLAGGSCIEDLELLRKDEAFLDMLSARRIPDPTTSGDFCRRFESQESIDSLQEAINEARLRVWRRQPAKFFEHAIVDADGTIAETYGEKKEGIDLSYKGIWGYQVLIVSLANTQEVLFEDLRPGSRPSHEGAADRLDQAATLLRQAGFKHITFRGDTDFSQTKYLDGWHEDGIDFVFGFAAVNPLVERAESLPKSAWRSLERKDRYTIKTAPRLHRENVRERIVAEREYLNLCLVKEDVAEFDHRPSKCKQTYRMVVVRKIITHERGQKLLFAERRYFLYITNKYDLDARAVVEMANTRCNQERTIDQLKNGVQALRMPHHTLHSNWAYTVMATLAWNLSRWVALSLPVCGRWARSHEADKATVLKMRFRTFLNALMLVPTQILRSGRRLVVRLLAWNPWQRVFFRALRSVQLLA